MKRFGLHGEMPKVTTWSEMEKFRRVPMQRYKDIYVVCPYMEIIIPSLDRNMAQDLDLGMSGMKERAKSDT